MPKPANKTADKYTYQTPERVMSRVRAYGGGVFSLDPCTTPENHLGALKHYSIEDDGLAQSWSPTPEEAQNYTDRGGFGGWLVFMNPPYGQFLRPWMEKAAEEAKQGMQILMLLPVARFEQEYFTTPLNACSAVCYVRKRIRFIDPDTGKPASKPPGPSQLWGINVDMARFSAAFRSLGACFAHMPIPSPLPDLEPIPLEDKHVPRLEVAVEQPVVEDFAAGGFM